MKNLEKIKEEIDKILQNMGVEKESITLESDFMLDLGLDSLDKAELVITIESYFDIRITDEVAPKMQTVLQAINYIFENQKISEIQSKIQ
jgi:acyl carrier protein